jgi:hypothetical protein
MKVLKPALSADRFSSLLEGSSVSLGPVSVLLNLGIRPVTEKGRLAAACSVQRRYIEGKAAFWVPIHNGDLGSRAFALL